MTSFSFHDVFQNCKVGSIPLTFLSWDLCQVFTIRLLSYFTFLDQNACSFLLMSPPFLFQFSLYSKVDDVIFEALLFHAKIFEAYCLCHSCPTFNLLCSSKPITSAQHLAIFVNYTLLMHINFFHFREHIYLIWISK